MVTWQQIAQGEPNPFDIVTTSTDGYSANYDEYVITDQQTVSLPSPKANAAVGIRGYQQEIRVSTPSGSIIDFGTSARYQGPEPLIFVSDGTDWYVQNDEQQINPPIPDGGVLRYAFEQDVTDSWNSYGATDNTLAGYSTDSAVGSYAKVFDGADDYLDTPLNPSTYGFTEISIAAWVRFDTTSGRGYIFNAKNSNEIALRRDAGEKIEFFTYDGLTHQAESGALTWNVGQWYHVVGVYDGSEYRIYRDGSRLGADTDSNFNMPNANADVGQRAGGSDYLDGALDDMRIYDKGLTDSEVSNLYNTGSISG